MEATFSAPQKEVSLRKFRLEKGFYKQLTLFSETKSVVDVRFYKRGETVCCCVWVNHPHFGYPGEYHTQHPCGGGKDDTFGHDRESAAFSDACKMAGYSFSEPIRGRGMAKGDKAMDALLSIGQLLNYHELWVHSANA